MMFNYEEPIRVGTPEEDVFRREFKTLGGATSFGCRRLKQYGYLAADRREGPADRPFMCKHVVAQWKENGRVIAIVWT